MATIFTKIIRGEIPSYKVAEDENYYAFLDINPLKPGHTLVVPKLEIDYIFDLPVDQLAGMMVFSQKVAAAIKSAFPCNRIGIAVLGLEVPHAHIHLVPMDSMQDINFNNPKLKFSPAEFSEMASKIRKQLVNM
jgi:histidine triad (HIT) family protein